MHRILAFIAIGVVLGWLAFRHYKKQKLIKAYLPVLENHDLAESNILIRVETRKNKIIHTLSEYYSYFGNSINRILLTSLVPAVFGFIVNKYFIKQNPLLIIMIVEVAFFFVVIGYLKKKKRNTFVKEFLTILNGLSSAVSSGQSINQAIHYVSQKYEGMVSYQFKQLHNQLSSGEDITLRLLKHLRSWLIQSSIFLLLR
ncbi:flp pilus assembly protein tadB [Vibrio sp. JCM 19236]|nr:flp pilus assembly protein tadB [Vibrio sp. JCM 19236]